jgi:hypothetical protein
MNLSYVLCRSSFLCCLSSIYLDQIQPSLSLTKSKPNAVLIELLCPIISLDSYALIHYKLISAQNLNKINCKIQDYFANRQTKEDVRCNNLLLLSIYKNMHWCIDITFDVDFTQKLLLLFGNQAKECE